MTARAQRLARGWTGAGIATSFAVASHAVAGGQAPAPLLVLLSLALSGPLCMALAGRVLSRSALLAGLVLSQGIYHLLFAASGTAHAVTQASGHAAHTGHAAAAPLLVLEAAPPVAHEGPGMVLAHVLAAAAAWVLMRRGEVAAVALLDALRLRVRRLRAALAAPPVTARPRPVLAGRPHVLTDQSLLRPVRSHRGPPAARRRPVPFLPAPSVPLPA